MGNFFCKRAGTQLIAPDTSEATATSEQVHGLAYMGIVEPVNGKEILKRESTGMLSSGYSSVTKTTDNSKEQVYSKKYKGRPKHAPTSSNKIMTRTNNDVSLTPGASSKKRGLNKKDEYKIRKHFSYLKSNLDTDCGLLDYFIQESIFTEDQVELIMTERTRRRKVDCLLRMLLRSNFSAFATFLDILTKTDNGHIRNSLESETEENDIEKESWNLLQSWNTLNALTKYKKEIVTELQPEMVLDYLFQYGQFTIDEYEEVISKGTRKMQAMQLMKILATNRHMPRGYVIFLKALKDDNQLYLYKLLEFQLEDSNVSVANTVSVIAPDVEYLPNEENSPSEEDDDDVLLIKVKLVPKKKKRHEEFIRAVNKDEVRLVLNDILLSETSCLLQSTTKGSIIIRFKSCCRDSIRKVLENGYKAGVSKILGIILSVPDVQTDNLTIQVMKVEILRIPKSRQGIEDDSESNFKKILRNSFDFLIEELDPKAFLQLAIFTEKEKENITRIRSTSRSKSTRYMLELALAKSEDQRRLLIEEIKHKKAYVWKYMFQKGDQDDPGKILIRNYKLLVENMCPSLIADQCAKNNLISFDKYNQFVLQGKPRSWIAKFILQEILIKNDTEINTFLYILSTFQQYLHSMVLAENGSADLSEKDQGVDSETDEDINEDTKSLSDDYCMPDSADRRKAEGGQQSIKVQKDGKDDEGYTTMSSASGIKMINRLSSAGPSTSINVKHESTPYGNVYSPSLRDIRTTLLGGVTSSPDQQGMPDLEN